MNWRNRAAFLVGAAVFGGVSAVVVTPVLDADPEYHSSSDPAPTRLAKLMRAHDCWSGQAPTHMTGVIPKRAVYTLPGTREPTYGPAQVGFDIWLHGKPGRLHGFCP